MAAGLKARSLIETATVPAAVDGAHGSSPADDSAGADAAVLGAVVAEPPPQAARVSNREQAKGHGCASDHGLPPSVPRRRPPGVPSADTSVAVGRFRIDAYGTAAAAIVARWARPDRRCMAWTSRRCVGCSSTRPASIPCRAVSSAISATPILLFDPIDPEPFWNRAEAIRWPADPDAFDRRLGELLILFTSLVRQPHIWPAPAHDTPDDLVARLESNGFRDVGGGTVMVLGGSRTRARSASRHRCRPGSGSSACTGWSGSRLARPPSDIVTVLLDAFGVESGPPRRHRGRDDGLARARRPSPTTWCRLDGNPAAVARRATFDGASYLSSIGTATWARGRGLGRAVTAAATVDAVAGGQRVDLSRASSTTTTSPAGSTTDVGFAQVGDACPDLLLIG